MKEGASEEQSVFAPTERNARITFQEKRYNLRSSENLRELLAALDKEIHAGESGARSEDSIDPEILVAMKSFVERAQDGAVKGAEDPSREAAIAQIMEIADALKLARKSPTPKRVDIIQIPFVYADLMHNPVGVGSEPAWNLPSGPGHTETSDRLDPLPSPFWSPVNIRSQDLYEGLAPILDIHEEICTYTEPKKSHGTSPGFSVMCGNRPVKVKFGEDENLKRNSEVAVTRIFGALGYNVEPNDYSPEVRVRYDRRIFLEFNSRKQLDTRITVLGLIPVHTIAIQKAQDPFTFVQYAVTKSGDRIASEALAGKLLRPEVLEETHRKKARTSRGHSDEDYRADAASIEATLDYLVMEEANVQLDKTGGRNIGPWDWDHLDHPGRRELRGAGMLAGWTNYFDARWGNNRLKLVERDGRVELAHFITDLGGTLGISENIRVNASGLVNEFPWIFTEGPPFRIVGYQPQVDVASFHDMTVDDARWMARMIAQLTENQIEQALIATGYTSAEVRLYTEKLISRRDAMIEDLELSDEIPPLRPNGIDRTFDYDPRKDGPVVARKKDGSELHPRESRDLVVRNGVVEPR